jgi:DnaJ-class molecular chaperone
MSKYEQIKQAMEIFGLHEHETIREIKKKINKLIKEWHPDVSDKKEETAREKSISLLKAKKIIMDYVDNYKISFEKYEIEKYLPPDELWMQRFGGDHIWGDGEQKS